MVSLASKHLIYLVLWGPAVPRVGSTETPAEREER
jgi:hypothetical protein